MNQHRYSGGGARHRKKNKKSQLQFIPPLLVTIVFFCAITVSFIIPAAVAAVATDDNNADEIIFDDDEEDDVDVITETFVVTDVGGEEVTESQTVMGGATLIASRVGIIFVLGLNIWCARVVFDCCVDHFLSNRSMRRVAWGANSGTDDVSLTRLAFQWALEQYFGGQKWIVDQFIWGKELAVDQFIWGKELAVDQFIWGKELAVDQFIWGKELVVDQFLLIRRLVYQWCKENLLHKLTQQSEAIAGSSSGNGNGGNGNGGNGNFGHSSGGHGSGTSHLVFDYNPSSLSAYTPNGEEDNPLFRFTFNNAGRAMVWNWKGTIKSLLSHRLFWLLLRDTLCSPHSFSLSLAHHIRFGENKTRNGIRHNGAALEAMQRDDIRKRSKFHSLHSNYDLGVPGAKTITSALREQGRIFFLKRFAQVNSLRSKNASPVDE